MYKPLQHYQDVILQVRVNWLQGQIVFNLQVLTRLWIHQKFLLISLLLLTLRKLMEGDGPLQAYHLLAMAQHQEARMYRYVLYLKYSIIFVKALEQFELAVRFI